MQLSLQPPAVPGFLLMSATFGEWLRNERTGRRLTLEALSERTGGELTHVAIGDWERGKREPKKANLQVVCHALLGEDADPEEIDRLFWKGWAALGARAGGVPEMESIPDEEYLQNSLMGYSGTNPALTAARATAESVTRALQSASRSEGLTGEEPDEVIARGRRKGITKVDGK